MNVTGDRTPRRPLPFPHGATTKIDGANEDVYCTVYTLLDSEKMRKVYPCRFVFSFHACLIIYVQLVSA